MKFGEKVRDLRKKHSLTQDELAKCLGVSKRTVIGWERDGRYPRNVEILEKMADIFHVPLTYIQPDQSLFIERAAATYGKKGKIEAQHLAFELTELFASGELTAQDMDGIMYEMHKAYFKYREQEREKNRMDAISAVSASFADCFSASCVAKSAVTVFGLFLLPLVLGIGHKPLSNYNN